MVFGRALADVQPLTDGAVCKPFGDKAGYLKLSIREQGRAATRMLELKQLAGDRFGQGTHAKALGGIRRLLEQGDCESLFAGTATPTNQARQLVTGQSLERRGADSRSAVERQAKEVLGFL